MTLRANWTLTGVLLFAAAGMLLAFSWPMVLGEIYLEHDIGAVFVPLRYFYAQCLAANDSFLWIPNIFIGFYLQGEGQNGMTHPLHLLLYRLLSFTHAFDLEFILSYPFMFAGMILFLRRWRIPLPAAVFGALLFTFSGYSMSSWLWMVHIAVLAHLPWLLWCIDITLRDAPVDEPAPQPDTQAPTSTIRPALAVFGVIILTASALLVSYPQMVYVIGIVEGIYALFLLPRAPRKWMIAALFGGKVIAAACAGVQVLPMLDVVRESTRVEADPEFRLDQSLHPFNLFSLVNPYLYHQRMYEGNGYQGLYGGAVSILLATWLILRWRTLTVPRWAVLCFLSITLLGVILTMGRYGLLYTWISQLPVIEYFRGPPRHGAMVHAGWVMLATFAFAEILRARKPESWNTLWPLAILPALSITLVLFIAGLRLIPDLPPGLARVEGEFAPTHNALFGAAVMLSASIAFVAAVRQWRFGILALVIVAIADLSWYHLRHRTTGTLDDFIASIDVPPAPPDYRIEPNWHPVYDVNGPLMKGYGMVTGLVSITPQRHLDYRVNPHTLQLAGAKWMRSRIGTNEDLNRWAEQGVEWIELPNPMPRARLVSRALVSQSPAAHIDAIDYSTTALVNEPLYLNLGPHGTADVLEDRPGRITVRASVPTRQLLILTEAYHAGWHAERNSEPATPVPVYGDFLGVVLEPGDWSVEFIFDPASWRWGKILTLAGCASAVIYTVLIYTLLAWSLPHKKNPGKAARPAGI